MTSDCLQTQAPLMTSDCLQSGAMLSAIASASSPPVLTMAPVMSTRGRAHHGGSATSANLMTLVPL